MSFSKVFFNSRGGVGGLRATTAPLDIYVDPVGGSDSYDGLTPLTPIQTLDKLNDIVPFEIAHKVTVHLKEGVNLMTKPWVFSTRVLSGEGSVKVFADDVWSPSVYTTVSTGPAQAGTSDAQLVAAGAVPAIQPGMWLEFTSGAAVGQRRMILSVEIGVNTTITPCVVFGLYNGNTPAPGDTYRVFTPACAIENNFDGYFTLVQDTFALSDQGSLGTYPLQTATWHFRGIEIRSTAGSWLKTRGSLLFTGVRLSMGGTVLDSGYLVSGDDWYPPDDDYDATLGWGTNLVGPGYKKFQNFAAVQAAVRGFFMAEGFFVGRSVGASLYGSSFSDIGGYGGGQVSIGSYDGVIASRVAGGLFAGHGTEVPDPGSMASVGLVSFGAALSQPRIRARGGVVQLSALATGQSNSGFTVRASGSGQVSLIGGTPQMGRSLPDTDYDVGDGAPVNKSFYGAIGACQTYQLNQIKRYS